MVWFFNGDPYSMDMVNYCQSKYLYMIGGEENALLELQIVLIYLNLKTNDMKSYTSGSSFLLIYLQIFSNKILL